MAITGRDRCYLLPHGDGPQTQTALVVSTGLYCLAQVLVEHPVGEREAVAKVFWARLPECVGRLERNRVKETDDNQEPSTNG